MVGENADEVLNRLTSHASIAVRTGGELVGKVKKAEEGDDRRRMAKSKAPLRRKKDLAPVKGGPSLGGSPSELLHVLARGIVLDRRGAARGIAEQWGAMKYCQALVLPDGRGMELSREAQDRTAGYYKAMQSRELGTAFALALVETALLERHRGHGVSFVPSGVVLRAGWKKLMKHYRPDYFAEVWKPGSPSVVYPVSCKGSSGAPRSAYGQLASNSAHVEMVRIGEEETPCFIVSTTLPRKGPIEVNALEGGGSGGQVVCGSASVEKGELLTDRNLFPEYTVPGRAEVEPERVSGYYVDPAHSSWFGRVLARADAANVASFAGDDAAATRFLSVRQREHCFLDREEVTAHDTSVYRSFRVNVQNTALSLGGTSYLGTDHVFRIGSSRIEAFCGVEEDLLTLLREGDVDGYRSTVYERRLSGGDSGLARSSSVDGEWEGPVSFRADGTILAVRELGRGTALLRPM